MAAGIAVIESVRDYCGFLCSVCSKSLSRRGIIEAQITQDQFVFAVIIPVMPFTLHDRAGVSEASGKTLCSASVRIQTVDFRRVQYWVSILLAVYGAATTAASRKFLL